MNPHEPYEPPKAVNVKDAMKRKSHTIVEPKLDGIRAIMHVRKNGEVWIATRNRVKSGEFGRLESKLPHLTGFEFDPDLLPLTLDGELLAPKTIGSTDGWNRTMAVTGASPAVAIDEQKRSGYLEYHVFDLPLLGGEELINLRWSQRHTQLVEIGIDDIHDPTNPFIIVPSVVANTPQLREIQFHRFVDDGFEGVVLKNPSAHYGEGRAWLKVKKEETWDVQVTGYTPGLGKWAGTVGSLQIDVLNERGVLRSVGNVNAGSQVQRDDFLRRLKGKTRDEVIAMGLILEVGGQELTQDRMIRFPRIVRERKDRSVPQVL